MVVSSPSFSGNTDGCQITWMSKHVALFNCKMWEEDCQLSHHNELQSSLLNLDNEAKATVNYWALVPIEMK